MNQQDQKELDEKLKSSPKFNGLYEEFITKVEFAIQQSGIPIASEPLRLHEIEEGKPAKVIMIVRKGRNPSEEQAKIRAFQVLADSWARRLSGFFPARSRWHWQEVFHNQALGGTGTASQRQTGGRRPGSMSEKTILEYDSIIKDYEKFQKQWAGDIEDKEYLADRPGITPKKLRLAKEWRYKGKPGLSKIIT